MKKPAKKPEKTKLPGTIIPLSSIRPNPDNPRVIRDEKFEKLKKSIRDFPRMMELRPIVVDADGIIQGGNMRYQALIALGHRDVPAAWVVRAEEFTPDQWRQFVIVDNLPFGEWDFDKLANEWDVDNLLEWGFDEKKIGGFGIPEDNTAVDEEGMKNTKNECPKCGFKW